MVSNSSKGSCAESSRAEKAEYQVPAEEMVNSHRNIQQVPAMREARYWGRLS